MNLRNKTLNLMIDVCALPIKTAMKIVPEKKEKILGLLCNSLQDNSYYIEYRLMPKECDSIPVIAYNASSIRKTGIILQGPICTRDNYTLNTIKYYKKMYPCSTIILSTWKGENQDAIDEIKDLGTVVILNDDVLNPGVVNTNRQKHTTLNGIIKAKELGLQYVAKTRTDQCLRRPHVLDFMINLLEVFPPENTFQKKRIITLPTICAGDVFYPYTFGDYFFFGTVDDMKTLWDFPDDVNPERPILESKRQQSEFCNEGTMIRNYLNLIGAKCDYSIEDHWSLMKDYFIGLDNGIVNLHYAKDDIYHLYSKSVNQMQSEYVSHDSDFQLKTENFGFVNWLNLYYGTLKYDKELEKYADAHI